MNKNNLVLHRRYEPDEDAMVSALALILRFKGPPRNPFPTNNETASDSLVGNALAVSETTAKPTTGETND